MFTVWSCNSVQYLKNLDSSISTNLYYLNFTDSNHKILLHICFDHPTKHIVQKQTALKSLVGARRHCQDVCQRVWEEPSNSKQNHDPGSHQEHCQEREQEKQCLTDGYRIGNLLLFTPLKVDTKIKTFWTFYGLFFVQWLGSRPQNYRNI